jgi:hypothetical protein
MTPLGQLVFFAQFLHAGGRWADFCNEAPFVFTSPNAPFHEDPVDSKVLTPGAVGKQGPDKVVDSKKMTPANERNADESKDSRRGVAAIEATVCREGRKECFAGRGGLPL